ncbi:hypothetical protein TNCV_980171 [Trichonephila clavipes]|uniref:Uncharacterized protein n=1 Tax=Trichonephila clavipes TaxID=2585209 RepID=A0A8X6S520_TRICX|nr:hypothetical protein TNCV_980171 [Trichonephila clavipes]
MAESPYISLMQLVSSQRYFTKIVLGYSKLLVSDAMCPDFVFMDGIVCLSSIVRKTHNRVEVLTLQGTDLRCVCLQEMLMEAVHFEREYSSRYQRFLIDPSH